MYHFIQQIITEYLYLPGSMLSAGDVSMGKIIKIPPFWNLQSRKKQTFNWYFYNYHCAMFFERKHKKSAVNTYNTHIKHRWSWFLQGCNWDLNLPGEEGICRGPYYAWSVTPNRETSHPSRKMLLYSMTSARRRGILPSLGCHAANETAETQLLKSHYTLNF